MHGRLNARSGRQLVQVADVHKHEDEEDDGDGPGCKHANPQVPHHVDPAAAQEALGLHTTALSFQPMSKNESVAEAQQSDACIVFSHVQTSACGAYDGEMLRCSRDMASADARMADVDPFRRVT